MELIGKGPGYLIGKGPGYLIGRMMWDEEHCIHRTKDGRCDIDGNKCPWRHGVKTLADLHDWYPCFRAEGKVTYKEVSE